MTDEKPTPPQPYFELKIGDQTKKILMSFALINKLAEKVTEMEATLGNQLLSPAKTREIVCSHILTLDENGRPHPDKYDEYKDSVGIETAEMQRLFGWVDEHLTDFFITSQEQTAAALAKQSARMQALQKNSLEVNEKIVGRRNF